MAGRAGVSRCSLQRRPRRDGEEAYLGFGWLRAPLVRPTWLSELSAHQSARRVNWVLRERPGSEVRVALSAPLERFVEAGELRLRLVAFSKKALSKLIKESMPRAGRWRCCTIARRRDETSRSREKDHAKQCDSYEHVLGWPPFLFETLGRYIQAV